MPIRVATSSILLCVLLLSTAAPVSFAQTSEAAPVAGQAVAPGGDGPVNAPEGPWVREIEASLVAEKFDDLDRMAESYRRDKSRLPGGDWKLRIFYEALDAPQLTDADSVAHLGHLERWMATRPESITARIALAVSLDRWAWVARGNGLANTAPPRAGSCSASAAAEPRRSWPGLPT